MYGHVITKFSGMGSGALLLFCRNFRCNLTYYESDNFSNSSLLHIFESEIFFFCTKNNLTWAVKCKELIVGNR